MKVNFVVHSLDKSNMGGVIKVVTDLANALVEKNIDVCIYSIGKIDEICFNTISKVNIISLGSYKHSTSQYLSYKKINWFIENFNIFNELLKDKQNEIWLPTSPPLNLLFSILKIFNPKITIVGCDHTSTIFSKGFFVDGLKYLLLKKLDLMVALTDQDKHFYSSKGINSIVIPNFVDIDSIELCKENERLNVVYVGRFSAEKQPLEALEIFHKSELWKSGKKFKMFGYGSLKVAINDYIENNRLTDFVEVIGNETNPEKIYKDAFCLLMTSKVEGFPMVLLEAISRGIPCFSYDCKYGPRNIITNGVNGRLIKQNDKLTFIRELNLSNILQLIDSIENDSKIQEFNKPLIISKWVEALNNYKKG
ncbi:glycosyltransferase [Acinetobacter sp.]|uniref:glycosyltransferase n=1 Tax=Acinetobacter sp. TaxID=472 RepID=UPI00258DDC1A|nr:glycosyltransferase [Acinetobacter sp.]